jgi:hypothetical protein
MKGQIVRMAVVTLLVFGVSVAGAATQKTTKTTKSTKPQVKTYTGTVKVTKDKAGKLTAVKLNTGTFSSTYNVVLDSKGRELGEKMAGKRVQVKGLVQKKSGKTVLAVRGFDRVVPKSKKKTPAAKPVKTTATRNTTAPR